MLTYLKNRFLYKNKYKAHPEAVIIACYYNTHNNSYRLEAFKQFYESIKHLNHIIVECKTGLGDGENFVPQKQEIPEIKKGCHLVVNTNTLLWHKESLINHAIGKLPKKYKYVFWLDADVLFSNNDWLVNGVEELQTKNIIQPFEYCVHLDKNQKPEDVRNVVLTVSVNNLKILNKGKLDPEDMPVKMWKSYASNEWLGMTSQENYDLHGHVGFAWGAKREVLDKVPLYDKALIGGADHIIAHAASGHFNHCCIKKAFSNHLEEIEEWSRKFYNVVQGRIGYCEGKLYHIWHGDLEKREYLKRIQEFDPILSTEKLEKDKNGLYISNNHETEAYYNAYMKKREDTDEEKKYLVDYDDDDDDDFSGFINTYQPINNLFFDEPDNRQNNQINDEYNQNFS